MNCHLASGPDLGSRRSEMFATALSALSKQIGSEFDTDGAADFNFILGDLNYRFKTTYQKHIKRVEESKNMLFDLDELTYERMINNKYPKYLEMPINFDPTYKREFDQAFSYINKKEQCPSYCDRIMFKSNDQHSSIVGTYYNSIESILGSDHRPVTLSCTVTFPFENFVDSGRLQDVTRPHQGHGVCTIKNLILKLDTSKTEL